MNYAESFLYLVEQGITMLPIDIENLFAVAYYSKLGVNAYKRCSELIVMLGYELSKEFDIAGIELVAYSDEGNATVKVNHCYFKFSFDVSDDSTEFHNFNYLNEVTIV